MARAGGGCARRIVLFHRHQDQGKTVSSYAIGDPQTTLTRFLGTLRRAELLASGDRLRADVSLLSMGDHFDFESSGLSWPEVSSAGEEILTWLASHPREQVTILLGNHDVCRVMEFYRMTDASFAAARELGATDADEASFQVRYPDIPTKGIAARDFSSFRTGQRELLQRLLLSGRVQLACVVESLSGDRGLATHAGVTRRELELLGITSTAQHQPGVIAAALNGLLSERVERVRAAWSRGEPAALDLSPAHRTGSTGREGGGLLYHRPQTKPTDDWEAEGARRYHPTSLPVGLLQVCGHTHHKKLRKLMPTEALGGVAEVGGQLRSLTVSGGVVGYRVGLAPPSVDQATLWMTDGRINHSDAVELLPLARLDAEVK
jgi:hypothetical protein